MRPDDVNSDGPAEPRLLRYEVDVVVDVLNDGVPLGDAAREHGVTPAEIETWRERFIRTAIEVLRSTPQAEPSDRDMRIRRLRAEIAELIADLGVAPALGRPQPRSRVREETPWSVECL